MQRKQCRMSFSHGLLLLIKGVWVFIVVHWSQVLRQLLILSIDCERQQYMQFNSPSVNLQFTGLCPLSYSEQHLIWSPSLLNSPRHRHHRHHCTVTIATTALSSSPLLHCHHRHHCTVIIATTALSSSPPLHCHHRNHCTVINATTALSSS